MKGSEKLLFRLLFGLSQFNHLNHYQTFNILGVRSPDSLPKNCRKSRKTQIPTTKDGPVLRIIDGIAIAKNVENLLILQINANIVE